MNSPHKFDHVTPGKKNTDGEKKQLPHTSLIWIHQENSKKKTGKKKRLGVTDPTTIVKAVMAIILDILTTSNSPEIRVTGNVMLLKGNMPTAQIDIAGWNRTSSKKNKSTNGRFSTRIMRHVTVQWRAFPIN